MVEATSTGSSLVHKLLNGI